MRIAHQYWLINLISAWSSYCVETIARVCDISPLTRNARTRLVHIFASSPVISRRIITYQGKSLRGYRAYFIYISTFHRAGIQTRKFSRYVQEVNSASRESPLKADINYGRAVDAAKWQHVFLHRDSKCHRLVVSVFRSHKYLLILPVVQ